MYNPTPQHKDTTLDKILTELYHNRPPYSFDDEEINEAIEWQEGAVNETKKAIEKYYEKRLAAMYEQGKFDYAIELKETPNED